MKNIIFYQLFDEISSTFTYILGDKETKEAIIIDPVIEQVDRDIQVINDAGLQLKYIIDTHVHADHITGSYSLQEKLGGKIAIGENNIGVKYNDIFLKDNEILYIGNIKVKILSTPGHTGGCISLLIGNKIFTGDLLFIHGTGRTDFQSGSADVMFHSIKDIIYKFPDNYIIYPGHDYNNILKTTVGEEKTNNPRISENIQLEEFKIIMNGLNLPYPNKIDISLPANLNSGKI